jgi:hypothetical protein
LFLARLSFFRDIGDAKRLTARVKVLAANRSIAAMSSVEDIVAKNKI